MSDKSYSYSSLATALRCNRLYNYVFLDKIKVPEEDEPSLLFGTALHCGLNSLIEGDSSSSFDVYMSSVRESGFQRKDRYTYSEYLSMGHTFLDRFKRLHLKHFEKIGAEERLYTKTGKVRFEGTPDFVGKYKGEFSVVDFKTSASRYPEGKIQVSDQLMLYAHLAQPHYGIKLTRIVYIVFIKGKEPAIQTQVLELSQEALNARIANLEAIVANLENQESLPKNHNACFDFGRRCKYWNLCHGEE